MAQFSQLRVFQEVFERYTRKNFESPQDRRPAIAAAEARLLRAFGTSGGQGIFHIWPKPTLEKTS